MSKSFEGGKLKGRNDSRMMMLDGFLHPGKAASMIDGAEGLPSVTGPWNNNLGAARHGPLYKDLHKPNF